MDELGRLEASLGHPDVRAHAELLAILPLQHLEPETPGAGDLLGTLGEECGGDHVGGLVDEIARERDHRVARRASIRRMTRIGILTGGGDCPGLNAVIRAIVRKGVEVFGHEFVGYRDGWRGPLERDSRPLGVPEVGGYFLAVMPLWAVWIGAALMRRCPALLIPPGSAA